MEHIIKWVSKQGQYETGEAAIIGKIAVGETYYDSGKGRDDQLKYAAVCKLPSFKRSLGHFTTNDQAKARVEAAIRLWFDKLREGE